MERVASSTTFSALPTGRLGGVAGTPEGVGVKDGPSQYCLLLLSVQ